MGVFFDAIGILQGKQVRVLAWGMSLSPEHDHILRSVQIELPEKVDYLSDLRADYTIKAIGNTEEIDTHRKAILAFARSFELIEEIPNR